MKRLSFRQAHDVFVVLFVLITIFFVNGVEAKSLKKGEVYSLLNGRETMEVISSNELEITERGTTFVAEYEFKGDKLRVVANVMGTKQVQYYLLTKEGLKDEKTGDIYYSKAGLAMALERQRAEEKRIAEEKRRAAEEKRRVTYTDNGNGTITHNVTKLMWQKEDDNTKRNWEDAIGYCDGLSLGGYTDWRLPNIEQLQSITGTGFPNTKSSGYGSSTTSYAVISSYAWYVYFSDGSVHGYDAKSDSFYVLCVRAGQ